MALILLTVPQQVTNKNKMIAVVSASNSQGFHLRGNLLEHKVRGVGNDGVVKVSFFSLPCGGKDGREALWCAKVETVFLQHWPYGGHK